MTAHVTKLRIINVAVFLLPLVLVQVVALIVGRGPRTASAGATAPPPEVVLLQKADPEWTEAQIAATRHVAALGDRGFGASPLFRGVGQVESTVDPPPGNEENPELRTPPPPDVTVQLILVSQSGNIALIDRHKYRAGDAIGDEGWVIENIDGTARAVTVVYPATGDTATLMVPLPR